jgi:predicted transcriptional regulator of viral defense system
LIDNIVNFYFFLFFHQLCYLSSVFILQFQIQYDIICIMNDSIFYHSNDTNRIKATELAKWLQSRGVSSITTDEVASLLVIPKNQVPQRLAPLKKRGEIVMLAKGLWAPVPPEYLTWGAPPALDIIDALMRYYKVDYYVGWLSAAELLGASHHAPQVFQVAVSRAIREKQIGRSRILFYHRGHIHNIALVKKEQKSGNVPISSKETTMLDIACDVEHVGGIDNAANLIIELCEASSPDLDVINSLSKFYPASALRRLGFLMERFTDVIDLRQLSKISSVRTTAVSLLDPQSDNTGFVDKVWRLKINREVNPDI